MNLDLSVELQPITLRPHHNYVAFFLTLACNLKCPYCINLHQGGSRNKQAKRKALSTEEWIIAANRFKMRDDLPLTLQGGEPTLFSGFYPFVNEVRPEIHMDLLTNMRFDAREFVRQVPVWRFSRPAPYAPIRVSYHPGQNRLDEIIEKTHRLQDAGFRVGIYGIEHPEEGRRKHILETRDYCQGMGLDFRLKEFLGSYQGRTYGQMKYAESVGSQTFKHCECRTSELLVDPAGYVFRCHADLYKGRSPAAHLLEPTFNEESIDQFRTCPCYGDCNPCDVKVKTNRYQIFGHTSVDIVNITT